LLTEPDKTAREQVGSTGIFRRTPRFRDVVTAMGWSFRGYGIAFSNPDEHVYRGRSIRDRFSTKERNEPDPDVFLCEDGLLRLGPRPLAIVDRAGTVTVPQFAKWTIMKNGHREIHDKVYGGRYGEEVIRIENNSITIYSRTYVALEPVNALREILEKYALQITYPEQSEDL
jgi:hypothetical protein